MKPRFKIGDTVYAKDNALWGTAPMKVVRVDGHYVEVRHPDFVGRGGFGETQLEFVTTKRSRRLATYRQKERELSRMRVRLFGH